jgi:hypothetical protein
VATAYPLAFSIAVSDAEEDDKEQLYRLIYSYLVRRAVCGLTAKSLNKTFARVVSVMLAKGVSSRSFAHAFADQTGTAVRFPSDDEFQNAIASNPVYQWFLKKERLVDILWELELKARDKFTVPTGRPDFVSVEHVLPQSWEEHWPLTNGRKASNGVADDEKMAVEINHRQMLLHTLGNLTLVTISGNSAASYYAFDKKKPWLKKSLLALNLVIAEREEWNEKEITRRANALAKMATKIWPALPAL